MGENIPPMHDIPLLTTLAFGLGAAWIFGLLAQKIGLSPIVGYLVGGMVVGPHTPGFVGDVALAGEMAEIGVILLMFGVGLHFHLRDLLAVRHIAVPGALAQSTAATLCGAGLLVLAGWSWQSGLVLGVATAVASTVVLMRVLMDQGVLNSPQGHVAVGWLIVEDLITVLVLVMLPALVPGESGSGNMLKATGWALLKLAILGGLFALAGAKLVPWLLLRVARLRSRELFTLTVLVLSISLATASYLVFGASMALGAFLAGMVVGQSKVSDQAAADAVPMRDAFAVLFFVSVGMLFDFRTMIQEPWLMLGVLAIILVVKPLVAFLLVILCGHTLKTALTVAAGLGQIGEFSFIVSGLGKELGLLPNVGHDLLVAGAIVSISLNPFFFRGLIMLEPVLARHPVLGPWLARRTNSPGDRVNTQQTGGPAVEAIVVGHGPVGQTVAALLRKSRVETMVVEMNIDTVTALKAEGHRALFGEASHTDILTAAGIDGASHIIITLPSAETCVAIIQKARTLNPDIRIIARARYLQDRETFTRAGATTVCYEESEVATALAEALLREQSPTPRRLQQEIKRIRRDLRPPD